MISNSKTQSLLTSGSKSSGTRNSLYKSSTTYPDLSSLLAVYYSDYDEHSWALSWIMEYLW